MADRADQPPDEVVGDSRCATCVNYVRPGERHRWRWWELTPAVCLAGGMIGGWIWSWSAMATTGAAIDRRVTSLEQDRDREAEHWTSVVAHLASIDTTLGFLKDHLPGK